MELVTGIKLRDIFIYNGNSCMSKTIFIKLFLWLTESSHAQIIWDWEYSQTWNPIQSVAIIDPNSPVSYWVEWGGN